MSQFLQTSILQDSLPCYHSQAAHKPSLTKLPSKWPSPPCKAQINQTILERLPQSRSYNHHLWSSMPVRVLRNYTKNNAECPSSYLGVHHCFVQPTNACQNGLPSFTKMDPAKMATAVPKEFVAAQDTPQKAWKNCPESLKLTDNKTNIPQTWRHSSTFKGLREQPKIGLSTPEATKLLLHQKAGKD